MELVRRWQLPLFGEAGERSMAGRRGARRAVADPCRRAVSRWLLRLSGSRGVILTSFVVRIGVLG